MTGKVVEALRGLDVEAKIVVGGSNPHLDQLRSQISDFGAQVSLIVDTREMPSLMAWADVAIAAGGTTSWELAFMGLPSLVIVLANNQKEIADVLAGHAVCINLGTHTSVTVQTIADALESLLGDASLRAAMNVSELALVDGSGVERVVKLLTGDDHAATGVVKSQQHRTKRQSNS